MADCRAAQGLLHFRAAADAVQLMRLALVWERGFRLACDSGRLQQAETGLLTARACE